jgi:glycosyltransferase involved in cell wall biosynthesis
MYTLVERLLKDGHDITILASPKSDDEIIGTIYSNVHYRRMRLPKKNGKPFSPIVMCNYVARKLYRLWGLIRIQFHKYDLCIAMKEGVHLKDAARIRAKRRIGWIHCDLRDFTCIILDVFHSFNEANKVLSKKYEKVICVSKTAEEGYLETIGDTNNLCVRYNPIDWKRIQSLSDEECDYCKNPDKPLIVAVGRLVSTKNFITLLNACVMLKDKLSFDLWIIGGGPEYDALNEFIHSNDLDFVKLFGDVLNPYPLVKQADLFVSASVTESYCLVIQESLILGIPVIAVNCPGVAESLDTRFGILIDNSAKVLAETINDFLCTPDKLNAYRNRISEEYSLVSLDEERLDAIIELIETSDEVV